MSYIGANKVGGMYLGSTKIGKAYLGSNLVYQAGGGSSAPLEVTLTKGSYRNPQNQIISGAAASFYTTTIRVRAGQEISIYCLAGSAQSVIHYYVNGEFTSAVVGANARQSRLYTWTATTNCDVGFSATNINSGYIKIDGEDVELIGL